MSRDDYPHTPVMADEALALLRVRPDGVYVDLTVGAGGHAERIASCLTTGRLIGLDRDAEAVALARERLASHAVAQIFHANYSALDTVLSECDVKTVDGVLLDAGVSSMQLDTPSRGFSFQSDGPLDMRMDARDGTDAAGWLRQASQSEIARVLREYGDIGPAGRIARAIVARREANRLERTGDLADAVAEALDFVSTQPEELRTVFQAIRMAVNEELNHLERGLALAARHLAPRGRLVAITFHSGEDRVVKRLFQQWSRMAVHLRPDGRVQRRQAPRMRLITRKPVTAQAAEIQANPRAKSAKMRALERLSYPRDDT